MASALRSFKSSLGEKDDEFEDESNDLQQRCWAHYWRSCGVKVYGLRSRESFIWGALELCAF